MTNEATHPVITKITLDWAEGPIALSDALEGTSYDTVAELDRALRQLQSAARAAERGTGGSCFKAQSTITLSNGDEYAVRHEVTADDADTLRGNVDRTARYYARARPTWMKPEEQRERAAAYALLVAAIDRSSNVDTFDMAAFEAFIGR